MAEQPKRRKGETRWYRLSDIVPNWPDKGTVEQLRENIARFLAEELSWCSEDATYEFTTHYEDEGGDQIVVSSYRDETDKERVARERLEERARLNAEAQAVLREQRRAERDAKAEGRERATLKRLLEKYGPQA